MNKITALRQKLHNYLEVADDKKIAAIYAIMESDIEQLSITYTEELKNELDRRHADYKSGTTQPVSAEESQNRIASLLKP